MSTEADEAARNEAFWEGVLAALERDLSLLEYFEGLHKIDDEDDDENEQQEPPEEDSERPQCFSPCLIPCTQSGLGSRLTFAFNGVTPSFSGTCTVSVIVPGTRAADASVSVEVRAIPSRLVGTPCDGFAEGTGGPSAPTELGAGDTTIGGGMVQYASGPAHPIALPSRAEPVQGFMVTVATAALPTVASAAIMVTVTFS